MDSKLRQLERKSFDDPEALHQYHREMCRIKGHRFTAFHRINDTLSDDYLDIKICWQCRETIVKGEQEFPVKEIPKVVVWRASESSFRDVPHHALIELKVRRRARKKAIRKNRRQQKTYGFGQMTSVVFEFTFKTACNREIKKSHGRHLSNILTYQDNTPTCRGCLKARNRLAKAYEKAESIYLEIYPIMQEVSLQIGRNESTEYIPELRLDK